MWDLGYWDGKPYPLGGSAVIHLPLSVLERFTREEMAPARFLDTFRSVTHKSVILTWD
jgi:hypothetical protein